MVASESLFASHPRRKWTAVEVMKLVEVGVLGEDDPLELIEGELIEMTPQGPPHRSIVHKLTMKLARACPEGISVAVQLPVAASETSLPEPDLALVRGDGEAFAVQHPTGADVLLAIEVAWSSQSIDRAKASVYARAGVSVYWLIDLKAARLEERSEPTAAGEYRVTRVLRADDEVDVPGLGLRWPVAQLLL